MQQSQQQTDKLLLSPKVKIKSSNFHIFWYTLSKMWKSPSTWVFFGITLGIIIIIMGTQIALYNFTTPTLGEAVTKALNASIMGTIPTFLIFLTFIFGFFKAKQVFRDEITDGTLLIFNTLPISRTRLVWEKILAFQVVMVGFITSITLITILISPLFLIQEAGLFISAVGRSMGILFGVLLLIQIIISALGLVLSLIVSRTVLVLLGFAFPGLFYVLDTVEQIVRFTAFTEIRLLGLGGFNMYTTQEKWDQLHGNVDFRKLLTLSETEFQQSGFNTWKEAINNQIGIISKKPNQYFNSSVKLDLNVLKQALSETTVSENKFKINISQALQKALSLRTYETANNAAFEFNKDITNFRTYVNTNEFGEYQKNASIIITTFTYLNVFKQWRLLMPNIQGNVQENNFSAILSYGGPLNTNFGFEKINANKSNSKAPTVYRFAPEKSFQIINIPAAYVFYILLSAISVFGVWYLLRRKDFA